MSDILITTTPADGYRRLAVHGQVVADMHRQLTAILGNRLGRQHAQLLARPNVDDQGRTAWYGAALGPVRKLADLPPAERRPIETLRRQLLAEISQLAQKMKREGDTAELVAHTLELATITPAAEAATSYAVGSQPVLVLWGHASDGQAIPEPPPIATRAPIAPPATPAAEPPPSAASLLPAAEQTAPASPTEPALGTLADATTTGMAPPRRSWLAWLLPLLLLISLAFLLWRALQPLPPVLVERQTPSPPAPDPIPAEEDKSTALRAELAQLTQLRDERLAMCKAVAPPEAPDVTEALLPPMPKPKPPAPEQPDAMPPQVQAKPKAAPQPRAEPPRDVAMAPMPPPMPPRSKCQIDARPGDEPEVIVIVDGSGSMGEPYGGLTSKMTLAKDAIANVVTGLPDPVDVALIDFSNCDQVRLDKFFPATERPTLIGEVRSLQPDRGTPLARSIERAGNIVSADVESTIVVVSDGEDTCGRDPCAAARAVKARRPNLTINVIDLGRGEGQAMMHCIASATGGKVLTPNSTLDMKSKVQQATRLPDTRTCK